MKNELRKLGEAAKKAAYALSTADTGLKNRALAAIRDELKTEAAQIAGANAKDLAVGKENGMRETLLDRLSFGEERILSSAAAVDEIIGLPDPVGKVLSGNTHPNGMKIEKVTVPLGVIGMIYEARPNVTIDAAVLCLKSGNAVLLRGGKEAIHSNTAIVDAMRKALLQVGLPMDCIQLISDTSRESAQEMMQMNDYIDVLIPRGGAGLIRSVVENATVPVIETGTGNCHIYVDELADIEMAAEIIYNAKTSRPSVCNAAESLLIHEKMARGALPVIAEKLSKKNVEIVGDEMACRILPQIQPATEEDWGKEYLDYKISVKIVSGIDEAIAHINHYGTHHSEAIVTKLYENAEKFLNQVDASAVYVNASTRFTDGGVFGFGAEIGISTQKLHARGPVGLPELVTTKYLIRGKGQVRN